MTEFMQYAYVFLWVILAALTFMIGLKQGAVGFMLTGFFVFMAVWYGLRAFWNIPVFDGVLGYVFRGVLLVYLMIIVAVWYHGKKKQAQEPAHNHDEHRDE